ncbi:MAG TPA: glycosyltransferase family 39 protein [Anaerolineales bacterium]|nr:glycosyltransferase family 39 protein [Anaerolineales bacterium]
MGFRRLRDWSLNGRGHAALVVLSIVIGVLARTWEYGRLPPSLNPDEASAGVEARALLEDGVDRNGMSFPVKFISWGSGQDVLYAYLLIPVIYVAGLSPITVRLPMLASALATLPLAYLVTRRIYGSGAASIATFMLAISPWHILLSRWALDSNLLPFVFLAGFGCLLLVERNCWWFVLGAGLLALCLYSYGTAYWVVPAFMLGATVLIVRAGRLRGWPLLLGLATFLIVSAPIALLLLVNQFGLNTIHLGPVTVPRFPVDVRWATMTLLSAPSPLRAATNNASTAFGLFLTESDSIAYNALNPYGIFYRACLILAIAGLALIVIRRDWSLNSRLLLLWVGTAACVGLLSSVNINRFNIIFIPMLVLGAYAITALQVWNRWLGSIVLLTLLGAFCTFTLAYHGSGYRGIADYKFQNGIIPALLYAQRHSNGQICITDETNMPYIYALFTDAGSLADYRASVQYVDPTEPLRRVASFGKYVFGLPRCRPLTDATYVLRADEIPPKIGNRYAYEFFDSFVVYYPAP